MLKKRWLGLVVVVGVILVGLFVVVISGRAPALSEVEPLDVPCVTAGEACLTFPAVSGANLPGDTFNLPGDLKGDWRLVLVPFDEDQQVKAQTWLPFAADFAAAQPGFAAYNVPVFPNMAAPMRALIRTGMNVTIPDADLRAVTITVFLEDRDAFLEALDIPNIDAMQVFLLNHEGAVLWRGTGEYTESQGSAVRSIVEG